MAFSLLFCDSFDHYGPNTTLKWTSPAGNIDMTGTLSRTGIGCLVLPTFQGPTFNVNNQPNMVMGHAYNAPKLTGDVMGWYDLGTLDLQVSVILGADGSLGFFRGNPPFRVLIGQTAVGLIIPQVYNYIEYAIVFDAVNGKIYCRINGVLVLALTGVNTIHSPNAYYSGLQVRGVSAGSGGGSIHDDLYLGRSTTPATIQNDFLGPVRIYAEVPDANENPLQWAPLAGTNFSEVNEIPPDGDLSYVSDRVPGDQDQYHYPVTGPTPPFLIKGVQHVLTARIDVAGARSIASDVNGNLGTSVPLTTNYHMVLQPYDVNPNTGIPFVAADFAATWFGPAVTA